MVPRPPTLPLLLLLGPVGQGALPAAPALPASEPRGARGHVRWSTFYDFNLLPAAQHPHTNIAIASTVGMAKGIFSKANISSLLRIDGR